jgi:HSP20 family protein
MSQIKKAKSEVPQRRSMLSELWDMDDLFSPGIFQERIPCVNVSESINDYTLEVMAPGLSKNDFAIAIENGSLIVSSEKEEQSEEKEKHYTRKEYSYNAFKRSFTLPDSVNKDAVKANYKDGILTITLEKTATAKKERPRTIAIA